MGFRLLLPVKEFCLVLATSSTRKIRFKARSCTLPPLASSSSLSTDIVSIQKSQSRPSKDYLRQLTAHPSVALFDPFITIAITGRYLPNGISCMGAPIRCYDTVLPTHQPKKKVKILYGPRENCMHDPVSGISASNRF